MIVVFLRIRRVRRRGGARRREGGIDDGQQLVVGDDGGDAALDPTGGGTRRSCVGGDGSGWGGAGRGGNNNSGAGGHCHDLSLLHLFFFSPDLFVVVILGYDVGGSDGVVGCLCLLGRGGGRHTTGTGGSLQALGLDVSQPGVDGLDGGLGNVDVSREYLKGPQILLEGGGGVGLLGRLVASEDVEQRGVGNDAGSVVAEVRVAHGQFGQVRGVVQDGAPPRGLEEVVDLAGAGTAGICGIGGIAVLHLVDVGDDELSRAGSEDEGPPGGLEGPDDGLHGPCDAARGDDMGGSARGGVTVIAAHGNELLDAQAADAVVPQSEDEVQAAHGEKLVGRSVDGIGGDGVGEVVRRPALCEDGVEVRIEQEKDVVHSRAVGVDVIDDRVDPLGDAFAPYGEVADVVIVIDGRRTTTRQAVAQAVGDDPILLGQHVPEAGLVLRKAGRVRRRGGGGGVRLLEGSAGRRWPDHGWGRRHFLAWLGLGL